MPLRRHRRHRPWTSRKASVSLGGANPRRSPGPHGTPSRCVKDGACPAPALTMYRRRHLGSPSTPSCAPTRTCPAMESLRHQSLRPSPPASRRRRCAHTATRVGRSLSRCWRLRIRVTIKHTQHTDSESPDYETPGHWGYIVAKSLIGLGMTLSSLVLRNKKNNEIELINQSFRSEIRF